MRLILQKFGIAAGIVWTALVAVSRLAISVCPHRDDGPEERARCYRRCSRGNWLSHGSGDRPSGCRVAARQIVDLDLRALAPRTRPLQVILWVASMLPSKTRRNPSIVAEKVGFEPTVRSRVQRFSSPRAGRRSGGGRSLATTIRSVRPLPRRSASRSSTPPARSSPRLRRLSWCVGPAARRWSICSS